MNVFIEGDAKGDGLLLVVLWGNGEDVTYCAWQTRWNTT